MPFDLRSYMTVWRLRNRDRISEINRRWREANPQYSKAWRDNHPDYQKLYREKNPNHRKAWTLRFPNRDADKQAFKAKALPQNISHQIEERSQPRGLIKPNVEEYSQWTQLSPKCLSLIGLEGCKYLKGNEFCNQPKQDGKPYCLAHSLICYFKLP